MMEQAHRIDINPECRCGTWPSVREWARNKISSCRTRNDAALSDIETAILRGAIQTYKDLLALEINPPSAQPSDDALQRPRSEMKPHDD